MAEPITSVLDTIDMGGLGTVDKQEPIIQQNPPVAEPDKKLEPTVNNNGSKLDPLGNPITEPDNEPELDKKQSSDNGLEVGMEVETVDGLFRVAENGDLVDAQGKVFKEAKDVQAYVDSFDGAVDAFVSELIATTGYELVDDNGLPIQYENSFDGLAKYTKDLVKVATETAKNEAFDEIISKYPIVDKVLNYIIANGGSIDGFNEVPDRSGITLNPDDKNQQRDIIRMQWKESKTVGNVEDYIDYLEHTNKLLSSSEVALKALQDNDKARMEQVRQQAIQAEQARVESVKQYYSEVKNVINSGVIGDYQIPDTIIVNKNGQKKGYSRADFYEYVSAPIDDKGTTRYMLDLQKDDSKTQIKDDVLRAYLKFTGGSFEGLVTKAIKDAEVKRLVLAKKSISTRKPNYKGDGKVSIDDILLN